MRKKFTAEEARLRKNARWHANNPSDRKWNRSLAVRLEQSSIPEPNSNCILWTKSTTENGYAQINWKGRAHQAHRLVWEEANGPIPPKHEICHRCDIRCCINLDHLWLGTHDDNMADMKAKGRSTRGRGGKLIGEQVLYIFHDKRTLTEIARDYGISPTHVRGIKDGKKWGWLTGTATATANGVH